MKFNILMFIGINFLFFGCNVNLGKVGNGKVVIQNRPVTSSFSAVSASSGLTVILIPGAEDAIQVEADENLQDVIQTEIKDGVLKIGTSTGIRSSRSKKVLVTFTNLDHIQASSGSSILSDAVIKSENLTIKTSSGGDIVLEVLSKDLTASASSGGDLKLSGKAVFLNGSASSGGSIKGKDLETISCAAKASSGGSIKVNVKEKINASASSGGDVVYYGSPEVIEKSESSSGSVRQK